MFLVPPGQFDMKCPGICQHTARWYMPYLEVVSLLGYAQTELSQDLQKPETELSATFERKSKSIDLSQG